MSIDFRSAGAITGAEKGSAGGPLGALIGGAFGALTAKKPAPAPVPWYENKWVLIGAGVGFLLVVILIVKERR